MTGCRCEVCEPFPPREWDLFVAEHAWGCIYQHGTWMSALLAENGRRRSVAVVLRQAGRIRGGMLMVLQKVPCLGVVADAPGGMLLDEGIAGSRLAADLLLTAVDRVCRREKAVYAAVHNRMPQQIGSKAIPDAEVLAEAFLASGYEGSNERLGTYIQDIALDDEALLNSFGANPRTAIRRALKDGVRVRALDDPGSLPAFYEDYSRLFERKQLEAMPRAFIVDGMAHAMRQGALRLFLASCRDTVLNSALVSSVGIPRYLFGATSPVVGGGKFPPGGQILHYEIMRYWRDRGFRHYDWGGSPGPIPVKTHPNYGVWFFKAGFRGSYVTQLGHRLRVYRPMRLRLWKHAVRLARALASVPAKRNRGA